MPRSAAHLRRSEPAAWYRGFLAFWVVTATRVSDTIDLIIDSDVIDSDLLTNSDDCRRRCEIDLATLTGRRVDLDTALGGIARDASMRVTSGLCRATVWQAHGAAEAYLAERAGDAWADSPSLARGGAMLSHASLLGASPRHAVGFDAVAPCSDVCPEATALVAVYASRSWRVTAPLGRLSERLPVFARGV